MKVLLLLTVEIILGLILLAESKSLHHRSKRIALRRRHHKNKTKIVYTSHNDSQFPQYDVDPWGNPLPPRSTPNPSATEDPLETDEFQDYPAGYFIQPGGTDAPEHYDYSSDMFNKSYLTNTEWEEDDLRNHSHVYKVPGNNDETDVQVPGHVPSPVSRHMATFQKPLHNKVPSRRRIHGIMDNPVESKKIVDEAAQKKIVDDASESKKIMDDASEPKKIIDDAAQSKKIMDDARTNGELADIPDLKEIVSDMPVSNI